MAQFAALTLVLSVTLGQRVYITVNGNPVDFFAVAFVGVAALLWISDGMTKHPAKQYRAVGLNTVGPLFAMLVVLPIVGVALGWYGITALYVWMTVAVPLAILSLGRAARLHGLRIDRVAFALILIHGFYGLGQTLARIGLVPPAAWAPLARWDASSQLALNEAYVISGRSTGLFVNANTFGLWSCGAILVGAVLLKGWQRNLTVALGVLGAVGSQSRTVWPILALLFLVLLITALRKKRVARRVTISAILLAPIALVVWMSGALETLTEAELVTRLTSGLSVLNGGVDPNLAARVEAWESAADFAYTRYPFGTFGPPQSLFGGFIDNQYVSFYLQGGVLLVLAFVIALLSPIVLARRHVPLAGSLGLASAIVAIASFTMLPIDSTASTALLWMLAATALGKTSHDAADLPTRSIPAKATSYADR